MQVVEQSLEFVVSERVSQGGDRVNAAVAHHAAKAFRNGHAIAQGGGHAFVAMGACRFCGLVPRGEEGR